MPSASLQWGRDRQVADSCNPSGPMHPVKVLQWGRDRQVADSNRLHLR